MCRLEPNTALLRSLAAFAGASPELSQATKHSQHQPTVATIGDRRDHVEQVAPLASRPAAQLINLPTAQDCTA
jgi:hypothetical protein